MNYGKELIHKNLTHVLILCFFHIHDTLGVGYDEKFFHKALEFHFNKIGI